MKKLCSKCGREVKETIHTQNEWKVDYFESIRDSKVIIVCVDCTKK
jgi:hypothetical protein